MLRTILASGKQDVIRFTVTPSGARTLTLRDFTPPVGCLVDWGDGTRDPLTENAPLSHTYADATPRQVSIQGVLGGFWNAAARADGTGFVTSLEEISSQSLVSLAETFRQCTALATLPEIVEAPGLVACDRAFYGCKSISSDLPALWLTHENASHAQCFTDCFLSMWGKSGSGCSFRQNVAAVAQQTYYQKYGTGCPSASYHAGTARKTYLQQYGAMSSCPKYIITSLAGKGGHASNCTNKGLHCSGGSNTTSSKYASTCPTCNRTCSYRATCYASPATCSVTYRAGTSAYYSCAASSASGLSKCGSGCKRIYQSGQSAYYKCTKSNGTCSTTACPWPYANETSFNAARNAGWA